MINGTLENIDNLELTPEFPLKDASRGADTIPNTTNLPNLAPAKGFLSGIDFNVNNFVNNPAPINGNVPSEIDSRTLALINDQAPGTFTQTPGRSHGLEVPFDRPKMTGEKFI